MNKSIMSEMDEEDVLRVELEVLRQKHSDLKAEIEALGEGALGNSLALSRMKKQKLALKDQIARIEDRLTPDIIA